ncbi:DUF2905 domain-containing protein [Candidatus Latescibacterota bacterium]
MEPRYHIGFMLLVTGIILTLTGFVVMFIDRIPFPGKLPGDITIEGRGWSFHFPLVTAIILSLILTFFLNFFFRR